MLKKIIISLCALVPMLAVQAADDDPNVVLIKARKGEMNVRAMYAAPLFLMAKGKIPYDAEQAQKMANGLKSLMAVDMGMAWKGGTGKDKYGDKTHALPEIWTTYPAIADKGKEYAAAVDALVAVAGKGLDPLKEQIGKLGQGCKGCHDDFREKE